jgi:hypothetical protein
VCWAAFVFSPPRRRCRNGTPWWWAGWLVLGAPSTGYACGAMVALRVVPGLLFSRGVAKAAGSELLSHGRECAAGLGFSQAKAFTNTSVGGDGGGVIFPVGGPLSSTLPGSTGSRSEKPVQLWTSVDGVIGVMPFLEASFPETHLGLW